MKNPRPIRNILEYAAARLAFAAFRVMPLRLAAWMGESLGLLFFHLLKNRREIAVAQLRESLAVEPKEARAIARRAFRHLGLCFAESARLHRWTPENVARDVDLGDAPERFAAVLAEGKGAIFVGAHYGNWEASNVLGAILGVSVAGVARSLDNPYLDRYVHRLRERPGYEIWTKAGFLRKSLRALRDGKAFGLLADQDAGPRGVPVVFFGRTASMTPMPAELAVKTGAAVIAVALRRLGPMRFVFRMAEPLRADGNADPEAEVGRLSQALASDLEGFIRETPEQWLWLHRRWKSTPQEAR